MWNHGVTKGELSTLLELYGFNKKSFYGDVTGSRYEEASETICAVAIKE